MLGSSTLATMICSSSGRYGTSETIPLKVCCTLRISAVSSGRLTHDVRSLGDLGHEIRLARQPPVDPHALAALDQHPQRAVGDPDHPRDHPDHADVVERVGSGRIGLGIAAGDHHDRAVAAQRVVDQLDAPVLADAQRDQHVRERDRVAQRQHADALGQCAGPADGDLPGALRGLPDLDRHCSMLSIGTERTVGSWRASG